MDVVDFNIFQCFNLIVLESLVHQASPLRYCVTSGNSRNQAYFYRCGKNTLDDNPVIPYGTYVINTLAIQSYFLIVRD